MTPYAELLRTIRTWWRKTPSLCRIYCEVRLVTVVGGPWESEAIGSGKASGASLALRNPILVVSPRSERRMNLVAMGFEPCAGLLGLPPLLSLAGMAPAWWESQGCAERDLARWAYNTRRGAAPSRPGRSGGRPPCWSSRILPGIFACGLR